MDDEFIDILMKNDPKIIRDWINSEGKSPKPISPIYFFSDLTKEESIRVKSPIFRL